MSASSSAINSSKPKANQPLPNTKTNRASEAAKKQAPATQANRKPQAPLVSTLNEAQTPSANSVKSTTAQTSPLEDIVNKGRQFFQAGLTKLNIVEPASAAQVKANTKPAEAKDAPNRLTLNAKMCNQSNDMWNKTQADGKERGATLIVNDKTNEASFINVVKGEDRALNINYNNIPQGHTVVGSLHTHPIDLASEPGGEKGSPHSGQDLGAIAYNYQNAGHSVSLVRSGNYLFGAVPTSKTPAIAIESTGKSNEPSIDKLDNDYNKQVKKLYTEQNFGYSDATRVASSNMARDLNMHYYSGGACSAVKRF